MQSPLSEGFLRMPWYKQSFKLGDKGNIGGLALVAC